MNDGDADAVVKSASSSASPSFIGHRPSDSYIWGSGSAFLQYLKSQIQKGRLRAAISSEGGNQMLWTLFVILFIMWLLGMVTSYTLGGFIHLLLVLALVAVVIQLITGRQPL